MQIIKKVPRLLIVIFSFVIIWFYVSNVYVLPWEKEEVIQTTLDWGGLHELPNGILNLKINKRGSMFTRQFIIEFEVDESSKIEDWIKNSNRLKDKLPILHGNTKIYEVYPGEKGSYGGKVEVYDKNVLINMSWN